MRGGLTAEAAVDRVRNEHRARFAQARDPYIKERLHDFEDLANRLLRVLAEGEFFRVGGRELIRVDVRVIAATHQDLDGLVAEGRVRADLLHRLDVVRLALPPLRERREDIPALAEAFMAAAARKLGVKPKQFGKAALQRLALHDWPGNVRELRHVIERACILTTTPVIRPQDLWETLPIASISTNNSATLRPEPESYDLNHYLQSCEREFINEALQAHKGQMANTAQALGISRKALWDKIKRLAIRGVE